MEGGEESGVEGGGWIAGDEDGWGGRVGGGWRHCCWMVLGGLGGRKVLDIDVVLML